jgi:hypothetical protein
MCILCVDLTLMLEAGVYVLSVADSAAGFSLPVGQGLLCACVDFTADAALGRKLLTLAAHTLLAAGMV